MPGPRQLPDVRECVREILGVLELKASLSKPLRRSPLAAELIGVSGGHRIDEVLLEACSGGLSPTYRWSCWLTSSAVRARVVRSEVSRYRLGLTIS